MSEQHSTTHHPPVTAITTTTTATNSVILSSSHHNHHPQLLDQQQELPRSTTRNLSPPSQPLLGDWIAAICSACTSFHDILGIVRFHEVLLQFSPKKQGDCGSSCEQRQTVCLLPPVRTTHALEMTVGKCVEILVYGQQQLQGRKLRSLWHIFFLLLGSPSLCHHTTDSTAFAAHLNIASARWQISSMHHLVGQWLPASIGGGVGITRLAAAARKRPAQSTPAAPRSQ